jgi:hypothetical protein
MNAPIFRNRLAGIPVALLFASSLFLGSCQRDEGFASPSDGRNLRSLGTFVGKATPGDSASLTRLINVKNPRVTVLWRGIGLRDKLLPTVQASVDVQLPFAFSLDLLQPPDEEVSEAPEIAFGIFCLFSDLNQNGAFDRLMRPDLNASYRPVDSLTTAVGIARANLLAVSELRKPEPQTERYYLEASGTFIRDDDGRPDTVGAFPNSPGNNDYGKYLQGYQRILVNQNRWERFFESRKKENEYYRSEYPVPGHYLGMTVRFDRAVFPKPGRESEFQARLDRLLELTMALETASGKVTLQAFRSGALDYPFSGYGQPGQDWMAGRAIQDLLLFFRTQATLDTLLEAYFTGSFRINHVERLHPGYNLFHCDDQYICDVRKPGDSILVYLGTTEAFFNAPATPSANPFPSNPQNRPAPPAPAAFAPWEGRYALNGSDTFSLALRNNELWYEGPAVGLLRVQPMDSLGFESPIFDLQGTVTPRISARLRDRIIQYYGDVRIVALSLDEPVRPELLDRIDKASRIQPVDIPDSLVARCVGRYDYGGDTLRIANAGGDSLRASVPGFSPAIYHAVNDSLFQCPWGELSLEFQAPAGGGYRRAVFRNGPEKKVVPVFNPAPSNLVKSARIETGGVDWDSGSQGSGHDLFTGMDGKSRYGCSEDGVFLRPGDGYLMDLSRSRALDSISQWEGGDFATFRFPGMKGKVIVFQIRDCAERAAVNKRIDISVWGGGEPGTQRLLYGDYQWMAADSGGTYWTFDSLAIDADPYYLTVRQENTRDKPFANAFDGYRLGFRP